MKCEICDSTNVHKLIWDPKTRKYNCTDCSAQRHLRPIHTNFVSYVKQEAKAIFLDKRKDKFAKQAKA